jgi:hypothetical protein
MAHKSIPKNSGNIAFKFAPFSVDHPVRSQLTGFHMVLSLSFSTSSGLHFGTEYDTLNRLFNALLLTPL